MITFPALERNNGVWDFYLHIAQKIALSTNEQGIPDGFYMLALCGIKNESHEFDVLAPPKGSLTPTCEVCQDLLNQRTSDK